MNISRRSLLGASGAAAAAFPLLGGLTSITAMDQPQADGNSSPQLSQDLLAYVNDSMGHMVAGVHQKSIRSHHLLAGAKKIHLLANHIQDLGVDDSFKTQLASTDITKIDWNAPIDRTKTLQFLQSYDPTLTIDDLSQPKYSLDDMASVKSRLQKIGLSGYFHSIGNAVHITGKYLASYPEAVQNYSPSAGNRLKLTNFRAEHNGIHVRPVQLWKKCGFKSKDDFCDWLEDWSIASGGTGIFLHVVCAYQVFLSLIFIWNPPAVVTILAICNGGALTADVASLVIALFRREYCH